MKNYKIDTLCVQAGYEPKSGEARIPPIAQSTTFFYGKTQDMADLFDLKSEGYFYSRLANPTVAAFEGKVAALEGGLCGIGCASGMSATSLTIFTVAGAGDNVVSSSAIYGGTYNLFSTTLPKLGIECRFFDPDAPAEEIEKLIDDKTKLIFTETIANPAIIVLDFDKIAKIADKYGVLFAVDNTLATPVLCRPKEFGAHIVIHSSSKYLDGHAAALGGVIVDLGNFDFKGNPRYKSFNEPDESYHGLVYADLPVAFGTKCRAQMMRDFGAIMSPQNGFISYIGSDTLALRMERHSENAKKVAAWLKKHPKVKKVYYVGFEDHRDYDVTMRQTTGFGGMLSFTVDCFETAKKILKNVDMIMFAESLGGTETLITYPTTQTHEDTPKAVKDALGITDSFLRMSVGIENADDIIADLERAMQ